MSVKTKFISITAIAALAGCNEVVRPEPNPQPLHITDTNFCPAACENLRSLGCEDGCGPGFENSCSYPDGGTYTCEEYCISTQSNGVIHVWLNPTCVKDITKCDQIELCAVKSEK